MSGFYSRVIFPHLMDCVMSGQKLSEYRKKALMDVSGTTLEIGFGTGLNLPHYPADIKKISAIDINEGVRKRAFRRITSSGINVDFATLDGASLPFDDNCFTSVVSTWTLCSIEKVTSAMEEVQRVLKPGGRFFFVEHGLGSDEKTRKWQNILTPIQKVIADGCRLNRDIEMIVKTSGLSIEKLDRFNMPWTPKTYGGFYMGTAIKR